MRRDQDRNQQQNEKTDAKDENSDSNNHDASPAQINFENKYPVTQADENQPDPRQQEHQE